MEKLKDDFSGDLSRNYSIINLWCKLMTGILEANRTDICTKVSNPKWVYLVSASLKIFTVHNSTRFKRRFLKVQNTGVFRGVLQ